MKRHWWTIGAYILANISFILAASWALLYAVGYKIDWQQQTLEKTGFILLESYPRGASVVLNDKDISRKTSVIIKRLLPDIYNIKLTKEGYLEWVGDVEVKSGLVSEQRNTLLTYKELIKKVVVESPVTSINNINRDTAVIIIKNDGYLLNIKTGDLSTIIDPTLIAQQIKSSNLSDISSGKLEIIGWLPDKQNLLFKTISRRNNYFILLDTQNGSMELVATGTNITNWQWNDLNNLYYQNNNNLVWFNRSQNEHTIIGEKIVDYVLSNNLYAMYESTLGEISLIKIDKNKGVEENYTNLGPLPIFTDQYQLHKNSEGDWWLIAEQQNNKSIWLGKEMNGIFDWQLIADKINSKILWDEQYFIYVSQGKLYIYDWEKLEDPKKIINFKFNTELIHFSFDTILYLENKTLKSIDLTGSNRYDLIPLSAQEDFIITSPHASSILAISTTNQQLEKVTLREISGWLYLPSSIEPTNE